MKARLEWRGQEELWLVVENETEADTELQALKIIVRWQQSEKAGAWKPYPMLIGPRMTFRLNVAHLARTVVEAELPQCLRKKQWIWRRSCIQARPRRCARKVSP